MLAVFISHVLAAPVMRRQNTEATFESTKRARAKTKLGTDSIQEVRLPVPSSADPPSAMTEVCQQVQGRRFAFEDRTCGKEPLWYGMQDLMDAYHVEQAYWSRQGEFNPWWAVDTNLPLGADLPLETKLRFYESGVNETHRQLHALEESGKFDMLVPDEKSVALDLGCGLGRMSNALAKLGFAKVLCVDHASTMLDAAKASLGALAGQGAVLPDVLARLDFVQSAPSLACAVAPGTVDYVHSVITLQHMKPQLQVAYIEQLCDALRIGGSGLFQIPVSSASQDRDAHCLLKSEVHDMAMHYTPVKEVARHLESRGCKVLLTMPYGSIGNWGKSLGFGFRKVTNSLFLW